MAPQSISFIGDPMDPTPNNPSSTRIQQLFNVNTKNTSHHDQENGKQLEHSLGKLNISSGSRTYRIPSPTRPLMTTESFQVPNSITKEVDEENNGKGFYISFDNEAPKRPKPPLRTKRSPKKDPMDQPSGGSRGHQDGYDKPQEGQDMAFGEQNKSGPESENSYKFDTSYDQPLGASQAHSRKHLGDVTNYEPQQMHTISGYETPQQEMGTHNDNNVYPARSNRGRGEGTTEPIIILESAGDPVSGVVLVRRNDRSVTN